MIISKDINPKKHIYYLGAIILDELNKADLKVFDYLDVYHTLKKKENISINLYSMAIDWLFLLGAVRINNGKLEKCI